LFYVEQFNTAIKSSAKVRLIYLVNALEVFCRLMLYCVLFRSSVVVGPATVLTW